MAYGAGASETVLRPQAGFRASAVTATGVRHCQIPASQGRRGDISQHNLPERYDLEKIVISLHIARLIQQLIEGFFHIPTLRAHRGIERRRGRRVRDVGG